MNFKNRCEIQAYRLVALLPVTCTFLLYIFLTLYYVNVRDSFNQNDFDTNYLSVLIVLLVPDYLDGLLINLVQGCVGG